MKKHISFIYYLILIIGLEITLNISLFGFNIKDILSIMIFSIPYALLSNLIFIILSQKIKYIYQSILTIGLFIIFVGQIVYYSIYNSFFSIYSIFNGTGQILAFYRTIIRVVTKNAIPIGIIIFLLLGLFFLTNKTKNIIAKQKSVLTIKKTILLLLILVLINPIYINFFSNKKNVYSIYNLYYKQNVPVLATKKMGVLTSFKLDILKTLHIYKNRVVVSTQKSNKIYDSNKYNILDIDLDSLIKNENSKDNIKLHNYFNNIKPTKKNEYTNYYQGKNLIFFVAESFNYLAINKNLTPTLYKLYNESINFNNFYTPLYPISTADGEYMIDTSLLPKEGTWSIYDVNNNYMPFSLPNLFSNENYKSYAYHNNDINFYNRKDYFKNLGFDVVKGCNQDLDIDCKIWPESDLEMVQKTINEYIDDDSFFTYYMTVSGHLEYTKKYNDIVNKNWEYVKKTKYSELVKGYYAANIELDKAVQYVIETLKEKNKLEDTVIIITGDHYPYGLDIDEMREISPIDKMGINKGTLLIWNTNSKANIVNKIGSSLDILPTISNLFGLKYDSRFMMGQDLFDNGQGLAILSNRSFITDNGSYNTLTNSIFGYLSTKAVNKINNKICNKFVFSQLLLENNYFCTLFNKNCK